MNSSSEIQHRNSPAGWPLDAPEAGGALSENSANAPRRAALAPVGPAGTAHRSAPRDAQPERSQPTPDAGRSARRPTLQRAVGEPAAATTAVPAPPRGSRALWLRMVRQQRTNWLGMLAVVELGLLLLAAAFAQGIAAPAAGAAANHLGAAAFVLAAWAALIAFGLYERHSEHARHARSGMAVRVATALAIAAAIGLLAVWATGGQGAAALAGLQLAASAGAIALSRLAFARLAALPSLRRRTLFLGAGTRASEVAQRLQGAEWRELPETVDILGFFPLGSDATALADRRRIAPGTALSAFARENDVDEIVIVADERRDRLPMDELLRCRIDGVRVLELDAFCERELGKAALELIQPSWCLLARSFDTSAVRELGKRAFDLGVALLLLALLWPAMLVVALMILIEDRGRGPAVYVQERVGRNGSVFRLFKFRSMRTDAEVDGVARFAQDGDSRVTRVGRLIRKARLDELPQLWNVLRGDMSMVGPRPERPQFVEGFNERVPHYRLRHCLRPGLSGWAQLRFPYGASEEDTVEKLRYDLYYVKFQNFRFDLSILLQTVEVVLFRRGSR